MFNQYGHHFWGMHWLWWIFWIVIILWIFIGPKPYILKNDKKETPLDILKRRYANGDISKEEFEERKKTLNK